MGRMRPIGFGRTAASRTDKPSVGPAASLLFIMLVAANLRAVLAAVGPVLPEIAADLRLSSVGQGLLTALPLATFALCSPFVHTVAQRCGLARTLRWALLLLGLGVIIRSSPIGGSVPLWAGTAAIGVALATVNVLLPVLVRTGFADRGAVVSGYYIAVQSVVAAAASVLAVPVTLATGSWRIGIGIWGFVVLVAFAARRPRSTSGSLAKKDEQRRDETSAHVWRSALAWQVAGYFGLQSCCFYILMTWLPSVEQDLGVGAATAGAHLAVLLIAGIAATLVTPLLLVNRRDHRVLALAAPLVLLMTIVSLIAAPALAALWAGVAGFALSTSMVLSLALINDRSGRPHVTSQLSSMVQGTAYTAVAVSLVLAGVVRGIAGGGTQVLWLVAAASIALMILSPWVGRDRTLDVPLNTL